MLRLALAQMRRSLGRLTAAAVAIGLGTAFVAATLLAGNAITRTTYDAVSSGYGDADLVVTDGEVRSVTLATLEELPGVASVHGYAEAGTQVVGPSGQAYLSVTSVADDPALQGGDLLEGRLPRTDGEVALPSATLELLGVALGDTVTSTRAAFSTADQGEPVPVVEDLAVVGVLEQDATLAASGDVGLVTDAVLARWSAQDDPFSAGDRWYWYATVRLEDGVSAASVVAMATDAVPGVAVRTKDEQARETTAQITGGTQGLTAVVLGFAAVAMLVAALVISNTFQVLVAQRTRTLALLRCVGADRAQLRRSVLIEASLLGLGASLAGVVLGTGLVQVTLMVLRGAGTDVPLPDGVTLTPAVLLVPVAVGLAVTLLASLSPARAATRVPALAALRPAETPRAGTPSGRARAWLSGILVVGGAAGLVLGMVATRVDVLLGLGLGVLGGAASFVGVVVGSVFWVPPLVGATGRLLGRHGGAAARLAAANSVRNPRRTASTSGALLIGVTLVAMMSTGAASARASLSDSLAQEYPVDVAVGAIGDGLTTPTLPAGLAGEVTQLDGVAAVAELTGATVSISEAVDGAGEFIEARGVEPDAAAAVLNDPDLVARLDATSVVMPASLAAMAGIEDGQTVTLELQATDVGLEMAADDGAATPKAPGEQVQLTAVVADLPGWAVVVVPQTLDRVAPGAPTNGLWVRLADLDTADRTLQSITALASDTGAALDTVGAAVERAFFQRVVDTLLAVVVGLLGVAVVIALVGVANTLSLSVIERRRESATLRAIGLSRRQLRGTLAIEGVLVAGVGSVVGVVLGTLYGWAGARTVLGELGDVQLTVPWRDLGLVVLVALLAGLLASVLPARHAVRTPPVEALAVE